MRRWFAFPAALIILITILPNAALAKPPQKGTDHFVAVNCDGLESTAGGATAYLGAAVSDQYGPDAYFDVFVGDEPALFRDYDQPVDASFVGGVLTASIPMVNAGDGSPAPPATITATLTPSGERETFEDNFRDGNVWNRSTWSTAPQAVDGTASAGGFSFPLVACYGEDTLVSFFSTSPNAYVNRFEEHGVGCDLTNAAGDAGYLFVNLDDPTVAFADAGYAPADGSGGYYAFGELPLDGGSASGDLETYNDTDGEPAGLTHVEMSLASAGEPFDFVVRNSRVRSVTRGTLIDIEGSIVFPNGARFDLGACVGTDAVTKQVITNQKGPKPGGKAPANDVASSAKVVKVGGSTVQQTKAASPDAETIFPCLSFEDPETGDTFTVPVAHTVWFKVTGTGSPITVDTAGSDFDTVLAVYTNPASAASAVACDDDVALEPVGFSLQAAATFASVAGTTYYVQVGGYPDDQPYGNLKLAVH